MGTVPRKGYSVIQGRIATTEQIFVILQAGQVYLRREEEPVALPTVPSLV